MIRALYYSPRGPIDIAYPVAKFKQALRNEKGVLWVDFAGEPDEACESILSKVFQFHHLAVDDALQETHVPKVDDWGDYLYIVLSAFDFDETRAEGALYTQELDIFLGPNYVVTHHDEPLPAIDQAWTACQRDFRHTQNGPDHLLYRILDYLVAGYMPLIERVDQEVDELEDQVFGSPTPRPRH